jgi:hypothetical protein
MIHIPPAGVKAAYDEIKLVAKKAVVGIPNEVNDKNETGIN